MQHASEDEIVRTLAGTASPAEAGAVLAHLLDCPICATRSEVLIKAFTHTRTGTLLRDCLELSQESAVAMLLADLQWAEIQGLGTKAQKERIATAQACKTSHFTRLLLGELSRGDSWEENERLAPLIAASINSMDQSSYPDVAKNDLRAELMIELGNSRRCAAEWKRADEALNKAQEFLQAGSKVASLKARFLAVYGSLEADRRNLSKALKAYEESASIYRGLGQTDKVARTLFQIADTLSISDANGVLVDAGKVFSLLDEVDSLLNPGNPLAVNTGLLRVECLVAIGNPHEAARRLIHCQRPTRGRMLIRYRFIGARLLHALDHRAEAERLFHAVVTDDIEKALFKDALLDLLFLLKLHLLEGELGKALAVCRRALDEAVLADFLHEQLQSVWEALLKAVEAKALSSERLYAIQLYMNLYWRHPSPVPPVLLR